ncbi:glycoside Hydrolase Family 16 protein, CBM8 containing [Rhodotorula toruloides]|uniref:Glycoside Hydrolase Family 16 protein, CBM8 containing n=1 Tax=Rhodotorula toruloides TaxID=5286 RepID=A0A511KNA8_RHOTO|nr:glycoside Hydrolase Family 16 protein, CBM8 containing [Rhodotorula toruloides]
MPSLSTSAALALFASLATVSNAAVKPTEPSNAKQVFTAGQKCSFEYELDETGKWTSMDVDLMTGDNLHMINLTRVASGIDGTKGDGRHSFTCPQVDPPAPIYFYQFTVNGTDPVWTTRFTLASPTNETVEAPYSKQFDGADVPWGVGHLVSAAPAASASHNSSSRSSASHTVSSWSVTGSAAPNWSTQGWPSQASPSARSASKGWDWGQPATSSASISATTSSPVTGITGFHEAGRCDANTKCPEAAPCCSEFAFCGTGRNCLAGCNPLASFSPTACAPVPACKDGEYRINWNANRVLRNSSVWNGDASDYDWLVDAGASLGKADLGAITADGSFGTSALTLSLTKEANGTTISSTRSILYGNVTAKIKSVAGAGIVTTFSLASGTGDEIDWEFTTNTTTSAKTAYFSRDESGMTVNVTDRAKDFHEYTISWTPDQLTWLVDDVVVRNLSRNSTAEPSNPHIFRYPRTPARIRFFIWAAGVEGASPEVVDFGGGMVDWEDSQYKKNHYFASYVSSVKVACYNAGLLSSPSLGQDAPYNDRQPEAKPTSSDLLSGIANAFSSRSTAASSTSRSLWWNPPSVAADVSAALPTLFAGWEGRARLGKRGVTANSVKDKRAEASSNPASYQYTGLDTNGLLNILRGQAGTTINDDAATGLNWPGVSSVGSSASPSTSSASTGSKIASLTSTASASVSSTSATAWSSVPGPSGTSEPQTIQEKWNKLGTPAHIGIYIAGIFAALFILVLVGWLWRKAASSRTRPPGPDARGPYEPIGDVGEMQPAGAIYRGNGQIEPGQDLYSGGQMPYIAAAAATAPAAVGPSASRKSSSASTRSKYDKMADNVPGFVSSSSLRAKK